MRMVVKITFLSCEMCNACTTTQPSNAPPTSLWPIKQPSLITNWVYFCGCECNLCISVIRWHSRNHNQAKTRTTVKTTDYPSLKPQPNKPQNHIQPNQAWKHSRTNPKTKARPILQPQPNYSQTNPTTAAEITLPLPECVSEITMCRPSVQQAQHIQRQVTGNRNKQHIKHTAEIHSRTNLETAVEATTERAAEPQQAETQPNQPRNRSRSHGRKMIRTASRTNSQTKPETTAERSSSHLQNGITAKKNDRNYNKKWPQRKMQNTWT